MSWQTLGQLPNLLDAVWEPVGIPKTERALLKTLKLPPVKPEFLEDVKLEIASIVKGETESSAANCGIIGQPRLAWYPNALRFLYGAGSVMIYSGYEIRGISVGGLRARTVIDPNALQGLPINGQSSGVWEDGTLVVFTANVREDIDTFYGLPNDPELEVTERYKLLNSNTLERVTTVKAPLYFSEPWVYRVTYKRTPLKTLASTFCEPKGGWFFNE